MNDLVFDSSSVISVAGSCLMKVLGLLSEQAKGEFIISRSVFNESVNRPMNIRRFELNALRIKKAVEAGWLKVEERDNETGKNTDKVMGLANGLFSFHGKPFHLIHLGEAETLALSLRHENSTVVVDERTTRMLLEDPAGLKANIERNHNVRLRVDGGILKKIQEMFPETRIVRSSELMILAFEKRLFREELPPGKESLKAALYSLKYAGCAISFNEIKDFTG